MPSCCNGHHLFFQLCGGLVDWLTLGHFWLRRHSWARDPALLQLKSFLGNSAQFPKRTTRSFMDPRKVFIARVFSSMEPCESTFIGPIFLANSLCRWNFELSHMAESETMSAMNPMPICHLRPCEQRRKTAKGVYPCSLFIHDKESLTWVAHCHICAN